MFFFNCTKKERGRQREREICSFRMRSALCEFSSIGTRNSRGRTMRAAEGKFLFAIALAKERKRLAQAILAQAVSGSRQGLSPRNTRQKEKQKRLQTGAKRAYCEIVLPSEANRHHPERCP